MVGSVIVSRYYQILRRGVSNYDKSPEETEYYPHDRLTNWHDTKKGRAVDGLFLRFGFAVLRGCSVALGSNGFL
jgi:hypothetical protein